MDGKRKLARRRRKRAWLITGIILLAYACYAVWDYTAPSRLGNQFYFERKEYRGISGVRLVWGAERHTGLVAITESQALVPYSFLAEGLPRTTISWENSPSTLDEKLLPEKVQAEFVQARNNAAAIMVSLPWLILRYPHILHYLDPVSGWASFSQLALGKNKLKVSGWDSGIKRWERYYEGTKTSDGFWIEAGNSRLWLYVADDWVKANYFLNTEVKSIKEDTDPAFSQFILLINDGQCIAISEAGDAVGDLFDALQASLPAFWELTKLKSIRGTAPDNLAWTRLERGLKELTTRPDNIYVTRSVWMAWKLMQIGPYSERNQSLALDGWETPRNKLLGGEWPASLRLPSDHLPTQKTYTTKVLEVTTGKSYDEEPNDTATVLLKEDDQSKLLRREDWRYYWLVLGSPAYIMQSDEGGGGPPYYWTKRLRVWFSDTERPFPRLPELQQKDEAEYGEMRQLAIKLAENEKELGEFGKNRWVKQFASDLQNRLISFRRLEDGTTFAWTGTVSGKQIQWDLDWDTYASTHAFRISFGGSDFQLDWWDSARIAPSPEGYVLYHNGPYKPLDDSDKISLQALIQAQKLGVVSVPDTVKGGWDKFVRFVSDGLKLAGKKIENPQDRLTEEQLMDLLN